MFFRMLLVIVFGVELLIGCTEPNEFFDNDGTTYTVVTYNKNPVDDYVKQGYIVPLYLELYKNENVVKKAFVNPINTWEEVTVTKINEENVYFFRLEGKYHPVEFVSFHNIKILGDTLKGKFLLAGGLIDTAPLDFVAVVSTLVIDVADLGKPVEFKIEQNYPNPFNPSTNFSYSLPNRVDVKITVYDLFGKEIKTLVNETKEAGTHNIAWNGKDNQNRQVATGVYLYKMQADGFEKTMKMMLMK